jgi:hypothetical protein
MGIIQSFRKTMIRNIAELIKGFIDEEARKLSEFDIKHGPTIGDMYEGLSAKILEMSIPEQLKLKITNGFIYDGSGNLTGQIDCMLVRGNGIHIPYTQAYKWHIKDVLAVFEVKKNLYSKDLIDSFKHLREVSRAYSRYLFEKGKEDADAEQELDLSPAYKTFSQITGIYAPSYFKRTSLSPELQLTYHTLITEQLSPLRVVLGYGGFKTENSLRQGLIKFLEEEKPGVGIGVPSFPHLITCNGYSLVKLNGNPYVSPIEDEYWHFLASTAENPLLIMLELIWTKLAKEFDISMPWGEDLEMEIFNKFLSAKPMSNAVVASGWMYKYIEANENILRAKRESIRWQPVELSQTQFVIIFRLCSGEQVFFNEPNFIKYIEQKGYYLDEFIESLVETRLIALDGNELKLVTNQCKCFIDRHGRFLADEDIDGRFTRWMLNHLAEVKK